MGKNKVRFSDPVELDEMEIEPSVIEPEEPEYVVKDGFVVNCSSVYLRSDSYKNAAPIDVLNVGTKLQVEGESGDFYKVITEDGHDGFVMKDYVEVK